MSGDFLFWPPWSSPGVWTCFSGHPRVLRGSPEISGMKQILNRRFGYGAHPRRPLLPMEDGEATDLAQRPELLALIAEEEALATN